jgi:prepilin-type N-terminal cleavage/methylation domain-containing protein
MKSNNSGFTMLEVMMSTVVAGIVMYAGSHMLLSSIKTNIKLQKTIEKAETTVIQLPPTDRRVVFSTLNQCKQVEGIWYGKRTDSRTIALYQAPGCVSNYIGTIGALTNETYDDLVTDTFWNVSGENQSLRILIRKLRF